MNVNRRTVAGCGRGFGSQPQSIRRHLRGLRVQVNI